MKKSGLISTFYRSCNFIDNKIKYNKLYKKGRLFKQEIIQQQEYQFTKKPKISVLVPLYRTPEVFLREMIESVIGQTYYNWELCLADGTAERTEVTSIVEEYSKIYGDRIQYKILQSNDGISANTNAALDMATGEYLCLLDHDDVLTIDALYYLVKTINEYEDADSIYTDEDKMDKDGKIFFNPRFKPDFNIDYLRTNNYICHLFCTKTEIARKVGGFRHEFDGSQDYDFIFRCTEQSRHIYHIPKVLYHWRYHEASTAARAESKLYAYEAGKHALEAHYQRLGLNADVTMVEYGYYVTRYRIDKYPWVTVVIHGHGRVQGLNAQKKAYEDELRQMIGYQNLHFIYMEKPDIYQICEMTKEQNDPYILLLDNRVTDLSEGTLESMIGYCNRSDIGVAAVKAIDKKNRIYHCGIIIGLYGSYGYSHRAVPFRYKAYYGRTSMAQDVSAVDATCTLLKKSMMMELLYKDMLSKTEYTKDNKTNIISSWNNEMFVNEIVDYCLSIQYYLSSKVIVLPYLQVKIDADAKKIKNKKNGQYRKTISAKFQQYLKQGDPYYNKNLSLNTNIYKISTR